jgi:hypothetical protein
MFKRKKNLRIFSFFEKPCFEKLCFEKTCLKKPPLSFLLWRKGRREREEKGRRSEKKEKNKYPWRV